MNKGDKVVCMRSHTHISNKYISVFGTGTRGFSDYDTINHIRGNIYEILEIDYVYNSICISSESIDSLWFSTEYNNDSEIGINMSIGIYSYIYSEHFITLADWRDKQINSILNE